MALGDHHDHYCSACGSELLRGGVCPKCDKVEWEVIMYTRVLAPTKGEAVQIAFEEHQIPVINATKTGRK